MLQKGTIQDLGEAAEIFVHSLRCVPIAKRTLTNISRLEDAAQCNGLYIEAVSCQQNHPHSIGTVETVVRGVAAPEPWGKSFNISTCFEPRVLKEKCHCMAQLCGYLFPVILPPILLISIQRAPQTKSNWIHTGSIDLEHHVKLTLPRVNYRSCCAPDALMVAVR